MSPKALIFPIALAESEQTLPYLSLGMVTAYLRIYEGGLLQQFYDITNIRPGGLAGFPVEDVYRSVQGVGPVLCLLSSYVWNHQLNIEAARELKVRNPLATIVIGGPEVPKYPGETEAFLRNHADFDIAVLGEGEVSCAELAHHLAVHRFEPSSLTSVAGIVYRDGGRVVRTVERDRVANINEFPSPYLSGEFEPWFNGFTNAILETNRGCPYGCTYCDWGSATLQRVTRFEASRVVAEIGYLAARQSEAVFIADANFGMLEQDIEIARALVEIKARIGYPRRIYTNFAKNGGRRLMAVIKILHEGDLLPTGIIALQTTDPDVLKAIKRDNIKTASYEKMMEYFNAENIPMASDLMIGLPGQTCNSVQRDLQFCFDWKVSANGNYTSMMPNAPMADDAYRREHHIVTDSEGMVAATSTFTEADMHYMKCLYATYQFHVRLGVLKYYLYYLQLDCGVAAITLLRSWLDAVRAGDPRLPIGQRVYREIFAMDTRSGDWALMSWGDEACFLFAAIEDFYEEFHAFSSQEFAVRVAGEELQSLFAAQAAVMPCIGRGYPYIAELKHNVAAYIRQIKEAPSTLALNGAHTPLSDFSPGVLRVNRGRRRDSVRYRQIDGHTDGWELRSRLRFY